MRGLTPLLAAARVAAAVSCLAPLPTSAQNTSGVPGPTVTSGSRAVDYRVSVSLDADRATRAAHRVQYEHALSGSVRLRAVGQALTSDGDARPEYLQLDLLWQVTPDDAPLQSGLRFEARVQDGPRPERLGLVWTSELAVTDSLAFGGSVHGTIEVGGLARDGVTVETRGSVIYDLDEDRRVGIEGFHDHGRTPDPEPFEGRQQLGPFFEFPIAHGWTADAGLLFGLSRETQDLDLRLFVTRAF